MIPLAAEISARFAALPQVSAIVLAGSEGAGQADTLSDIDLYVYSGAAVPVEARCAIAQDFADRVELDNRFWEPGDEWIDRASGRAVDIMYRTPAWIEEQLTRVLVRHEASIGYSTCFWWNVLHSRPLFDRDGRYGALQQRARQPYPPELQRAIIDRNYPILRRNISSYRRQIECAIERADLVSVNHRVAAFLASYWDVVFALNAVPHPGEKRLVEHARRLCPRLPREWEAALAAVFTPPVLPQIDRLAAGLEEILDSRDASA